MLAAVDVHLIDGTYELFRHYFALPGRSGPSGAEVAAAGGVLESLVGLLERGATHVGVATDRVITSFRNDLYDGYKAGEGTAPELLAQFPILEQVLEAAGFTVFAMVEHEADDAMATASAIAERDDRVTKVWICTPDKDLAQCVSDPPCRAVRQAAATRIRRGGRTREIRREARVDPRLPRVDGRPVRRVPRAARLGSPVVGDGACSL